MSFLLSACPGTFQKFKQPGDPNFLLSQSIEGQILRSLTVGIFEIRSLTVRERILKFGKHFLKQFQEILFAEAIESAFRNSKKVRQKVAKSALLKS